MEFCIDQWLEVWMQAVREQFGKRIVFLGLQGSYGRGEARETSDIDVVIILDALHLADLEAYRKCIASMPDAHKACGFISGKSELLHWAKADLFQFCYDTKALYGTLDDVNKLVSRQDVVCALKTGASNLYHALCHSFVFEPSRDQLAELYKMTFFILQAKVFLDEGVYVPTQAEMCAHVSGEDAAVLHICRNRHEIMQADDLSPYYETLLHWSGDKLRTF